MLIYLDSMIVQYIADYTEYILMLGGYLTKGDVDLSRLPTADPKLMTEIQALGRLAFLEQLGSDWQYAATPHLMGELMAGKPTPTQVRFYRHLESTWHASAWLDAFPLDSHRVSEVEMALLASLDLSGGDRLHVAQAVVLNASWFLTNDSAIIRKSQDAELPVRVCRPSACLEDISAGLFLAAA